VNDPSRVNVARSTSVDVATEEGGATLLKNDGILPLAGTHRTIAVIGQAAQQYVFGYGSSQVTPSHVVTLLQGIRGRAAQAGDKVIYDDGMNLVHAEADARKADVAIVVAADSESEGDDKLCMSLTPWCAPTQISTLAPQNAFDEQAAWGDQDQLIRDVAAAGKDTVTVLETGAPVLTPWRHELAALLEVWYPGQDGGTAVARILWGDVDPGGRLPVTFPARYRDEPTARNPSCYPGLPGGMAQASAGAGTLYTERVCEGVFAGYRWFDARGLAPAYPFGYGLSYTTFELSDLKVNDHSVSLRVRNTGARSGEAVPQVYLGLPGTRTVPQPPAQLAGYEKVTLAPGASTTVTIALPERSFQYYNPRTSSWALTRGCVKVMAGTSSRNLPLRASIAQGGAQCLAAARRRGAL
jgi:beta-glucosidase